MRQFLAAVAAIMKSMGHFVTRLVRKGGRWVAELVRVPGQAAPAIPTAPVAVKQGVDDYDAMKRLAKMMLQGADPTAADLRAVPELSVKWLASLDRISLSKVALSDDSVLRGHIRGGQPMRGVVPYDEAAVADIERSRKAPAAVAKQQRTRRQVLEAAGVMIPA